MCFDIRGLSNKLYRRMSNKLYWRMSNKIYRRMSNKLYRRVVQQILSEVFPTDLFSEGCLMDVDIGDCPMSFINKNHLF